MFAVLLVGFGNVNFMDKTGKFLWHRVENKERTQGSVGMVCVHACTRYSHNKKYTALNFINSSSNLVTETVVSMNIVFSASGFCRSDKIGQCNTVKNYKFTRI